MIAQEYYRGRPPLVCICACAVKRIPAPPPCNAHGNTHALKSLFARLMAMATGKAPPEADLYVGRYNTKEIVLFMRSVLLLTL